jgi:uncharacterized protein (DUF2461 family)
MNIYALKNKIKQLQAANDPKNRYWVMFLQDLYNKELQNIATKVTQDLDQVQKDNKSWSSFLAN